MSTGILKATDLIKAVWRVVAPLAYGRYLARGRGGVLIPVGGVKLRPGGEEIIDAPARYVTADDIASGKVNVPSETVQEFERYDPEREVVFLFDEGKGIATYRGAPADQSTPKELYDLDSSSGN